jgi:hypothetical protein
MGSLKKAIHRKSERVANPVVKSLRLRAMTPAFWLGLISISCLGIVGAMAISYSFVCSAGGPSGGCGSFYNHSITVTVENGLLINPTNVPWYNTGNNSLASAMAASLGYQSDTTPYFAYSSSLIVGYNVVNVPTASGQVVDTQALALNLGRYFVTGFTNNGEVPEIDRAGLPKAVMLVIFLFLLFRYRGRSTSA